MSNSSSSFHNNNNNDNNANKKLSDKQENLNNAVSINFCYNESQDDELLSRFGDIFIKKIVGK